MKAIFTTSNMNQSSTSAHEDLQCMCAEWNLDVVWNSKKNQTIVEGSNDELAGLIENEIKGNAPYMLSVFTISMSLF